MNSYERIYGIVKQIPRGSVSTYGRIAALAGNPRLSRVVGYALHVNPDPGGIPCHRVVNRLGGTAPGFVFGGEGAQRRLLELEGIMFGEDGRIDLREFGWPDGGAARAVLGKIRRKAVGERL